MRLRKTLLFIATIFLGTAYSQSPEKMSYQAVIRDANNQLVSNQSIGMQLSILQGSVNGTAVYVETQTPTSNDNGLVSVELGSGTVQSGDFTTIDWANGPYFIQTETDPSGGTSYSITGTSQLLSVPYALHAKNSDGWTTEGDTTFSYNHIGIGVDTVNENSSLNIYKNDAGNFIRMDGGIANSRLTLNQESSGVTNIQFLDQGSSSNSVIQYLPTQANGMNGEPTLRFFYGVSQGPDRNWAFRANGANIMTIEGDRKVTMNNVMRLVPRSTAPSNPVKGEIYMDDTTNKLRVYDGTQWQDCW